MRIAGALGALGLSVSLLLACTSEEERRQQFAESAEQYYANEQWSEAKIEFLNLLQLDPENAEANFKLGETHARLGEYGDALYRYQEAVRIEPTNTEWRLQLASWFLAANRSDDALGHAEQIIEQDPRNATALVLRGRVRMAKGLSDAALQDFEAALALEPGRADALTLSAQLHAQAGRADRAEEAIRKVVEHHKNAASHVLLGTFLAQLGRESEALEQYQLALDTADDPDVRMRVNLLLANYHITKESFGDAEKHLLAARKEVPDNRELVVQLARFYVTRDQRDKAQALLEEFVAAKPDDVSSYLTLAEFHQRSQDFDKALEAIRKALEVEPGSVDAQLLQAQFLMERRGEPGNETRARELLAKVLEDHPQNAQALFTDGKFLLLDQKHEEAATRLRKVVQEQPTANAHFLLGTAYRGMNEAELAKAEFLRALQLDANHRAAHAQLALLQLGQGNRELAIEEARRALGGGDDARMHLVIAQANQELGKKEAALEALEKLDPDQTPEPLTFRLQKAELYRRLLETAEARKILDPLLEEQPANAEVLRVMVAVDTTERRPQASLPRLDRAIERDPGNAKLYEIRGAMRMGFQQQGRLLFADPARKDIEKAIELNPESPVAYGLLARLLQTEGNYDESIRQYEAAISKDPLNTTYYLALGSLFQALGKHDRAIETYEQLIAFDRDNALGKNNLAWLLADAEEPRPERLDRALELARDAKAKMPTSPDVADTLGWVMYKKDIPSAAIPLFREAISSYREGTPERAAARYHLGLAYERNGETDRARQELRGALDEVGEFPGRADAEAAYRRLGNS
jgi:tetratricopeptide (TPR) repeat protein